MPVRRRPLPFRRVLVAVCLLASVAGALHAQFIPIPPVPGVYIEQDGNVRSREVDQTKQLAELRARAKSVAQAAKDPALAFVSLPKTFAAARAAIDAGKPVPDELRYLGGLTQVRYVFVYPDEKDLVIAGPAEPFVVQDGGLYATGKRTGRPVMQLDDLVVAMRTADESRGRAFGCRIDPNPKSLEISKEVMAKYARKSRRERMDAMAKALGPQKVSVFGTAADTRLAFVCVAADYKLKRFALALEPAASQATGIGHAVDNTRSAMNRFWFETGFDPLRVSPAGDAFEFRGPMWLGARQLDLVRWPAARLYALEFARPEYAERHARETPFKIALARVKPKDKDSGDVERFRLRQVTNRDGRAVALDRLTLRLQTLPRREGYWLDTGMLKTG